MSDPYLTVPAGDGGPAPGTPPGGSGGTGRRRAWFIVLGIVAALLIIAVTIAITLLATRGGEPAPGTSTAASPSPTASPSTTPSVSPTATPTATPTPTAATPSPTQAPSQSQASIASFTGPSTAGCLAQSAPAFRPTSTITFSWSASGVNRVAFGVATNDAIAQPYQSDLPPSGSIQVDYPCTNAQQSYTLTVAGPDGVHVSKTLQVRSGAN